MLAILHGHTHCKQRGTENREAGGRIGLTISPKLIFRGDASAGAAG